MYFKGSLKATSRVAALLLILIVAGALNRLPAFAFSENSPSIEDLCTVSVLNRTGTIQPDKGVNKGVKSLVVHRLPEALGGFSRENQGQIYFLSFVLGRPRLRRISGWPIIPASSPTKVSEPPTLPVQIP